MRAGVRTLATVVQAATVARDARRSPRYCVEDGITTTPRSRASTRSGNWRRRSSTRGAMGRAIIYLLFRQVSHRYHYINNLLIKSDSRNWRLRHYLASKFTISPYTVKSTWWISIIIESSKFFTCDVARTRTSQRQTPSREEGIVRTFFYQLAVPPRQRWLDQVDHIPGIHKETMRRVRPRSESRTWQATSTLTDSRQKNESHSTRKRQNDDG